MSAFVVAMALCYVLIKIPFWILGSVKISQSRSVLGSMAKAFVAYKTAGLVGAGAKKALGAVSSRRVPHPSGRGWTRNDPYEQTSWESDGQGVLPLPGVGPTSWGPRSRQAQAADAQEQTSGQRGTAAGSGPARPGRHQLAMVTRHGTVKRLPPDRRRSPHPGVPRAARPGEQMMMRVFAGYEPQRVPRESVHDTVSAPRPEPPQPPASEQPALFTPDGRIRSHARPAKPQPGAVPRSRPGEQMALNMPLRLSAEQAQRRAQHLAKPTAPQQPDPVKPAPPEQTKPASPSQWPRVQGQQSLLRRDGSVHPRARARISPQVRQRARQQQHRRAHSAPASPEFLPPQPPGARTRRGRTAPAPETPTGPDPGARRTRSTRLNTPSADNSGTRSRRKETKDE